MVLFRTKAAKTERQKINPDEGEIVCAEERPFEEKRPYAYLMRLLEGGN